jgi:hypothetical protein
VESYMLLRNIYRGAAKSLARTERKNATATEVLMFIFIIIIGGILVLFIYSYITRLASKEIFSPSKKYIRK